MILDMKRESIVRLRCCGALLCVLIAVTGAASAQTPATVQPGTIPGSAHTTPGSTPAATAPMATAPAPEAATPVAGGAPEPGSGAAQPEQPSVSASLLPRDLSPWGMFLSAHIVVKLVMIGLALASFLTWTVALAKGIELITAKRRVRDALRMLAQVTSLTEAAAAVGNDRSFAAPVRAAATELRLSANTSDKEGIKERVASRLERIEASAGRRMARGTGLLATVGAIAPFVGLFGTVWGIMNSFIGISKQHTTNLAVVAPGIAEALLATALGLAAAIPAVVIYNMFSRAIAEYRALYADGSAEILRLVSRDLDHVQQHSAPRGRSAAALSPAE
jgi:biopolymer transport protein ExbB